MGEQLAHINEGNAVIIMGVSGAGKSTIGNLLAKSLLCPFIDADDFHTAANKEKMRNGIALTDEDRLPWLEKLRDELEKYTSRGESVVLACSALRNSYRDILLTAYPSPEGQGEKGSAVQKSPDLTSKSGYGRSPRHTGQAMFVHLKGNAELFASRLAARHKEGTHFVTPDLLKSQLGTLEIRDDDESMISVDASLKPEDIVDHVKKELLLRVKKE